MRKPIWLPPKKCSAPRLSCSVCSTPSGSTHQGRLSSIQASQAGTARQSNHCVSTGCGGLDPARGQVRDRGASGGPAGGLIKKISANQRTDRLRPLARSTQPRTASLHARFRLIPGLENTVSPVSGRASPPEFDTNSYKRMICIGRDLQRTTTASSTGCLWSVFSASVPRTLRLVLD